ncbi:Stc1 domain-containing protein [Apodospora peruviana]|uniref:Stc1 domain-containing protein n=1 Tax=Apodospora peruviana TaxID=516989 RepID=A0AAE0HYL5_9PEZI|nr:Stc1 domain-containing protein [Apodospora peruviana]
MTIRESRPTGSQSQAYRPASSKASSSTKIRCAMGGEWKSRDQFSKRQLTKYDGQRSGTPNASGIICREHTASQILEHQCRGPCDRILPQDKFSTNTRRQNKFWCFDCTELQLAEPKEQVAPAGAQLAADKRQEAEVKTTGYQMTDDCIFSSETGEESTTMDQTNASDAVSTASSFTPGRALGSYTDGYTDDADEAEIPHRSFWLQTIDEARTTPTEISRVLDDFHLDDLPDLTTPDNCTMFCDSGSNASTTVHRDQSVKETKGGWTRVQKSVTIRKLPDHLRYDTVPLSVPETTLAPHLYYDEDADDYN